MPTSVSNNSKWTTNNSWPFSWPFYSYPPLPHELTHEINMSSSWKSTWAHPGNQHELTLETNMSSPWKSTWALPGNQHELYLETNMSSTWKPTWPFLEKPPTTRVFYQQDLSTGYTCQPKKTNLTHNYVIWTTHLNNPSETHQRLIHIEIPNNPI